jgi:hypothetical protein
MSQRSLANRKSKKRRDPYLLALGRIWPTILQAYRDFKDRRPIVEYCVWEKIVYAYPAVPYLSGLTDSTRSQTKQQYREAAATGRFMVFVRDSRKRVYRSYVFPVGEREEDGF